MEERNFHNGRIYMTSIIFLIFLSLIIIRLFNLQVKDNISFQILANNEQGYSSLINTPRGIITSSDGVELAINVPSYDAFVYTPSLVNISDFENNDLKYFGFNKSTFDDEVNAGIRYFQVGRGLSPSQKDIIKKDLSDGNIQAIQFVLSEKRSYPNDTFLSQVIGFVNTSSGQGNYGIEGYYDGDLKGVNGNIVGNKDQFGNPIVNSNFNFIPPTPGENILLTVDAHIQNLIEQKLKYWVDDRQADSGSVILMDPKTGAIIAMANYPTFDPNSYYKGYTLDCNNAMFKDTDACKDPSKSLDQSLLQSSFDNQAISFLYEPGSVIKTITAAAALQEGKITPDTMFDDKTGVYQADGEKVYNFNKLPDHQMNMQQILKLSSNVGASMVASILGKNNLYKYYKDFGIGALTGITLDGEQTSSLPDVSSWSNIDLATASFGQYIDATPLQVINIYQTIANGGIRMKPYIVKSVEKDGTTVSTKPQEASRVVSNDTAKKVTDMLVYTTTGEPAYGLTGLKNYLPIIASKTGTAQVPLPNKAGYSDTLINTTYVGYAPANDPKFVMLTMLKYPRKGQYSSETAVPLWGDIAKDLFVYFKIPPQ